MMEVGLRQHIIDQRDNALKELMTQRNCEGARIFLKNEVCPVLLNWWKSTTNYRCITFYEINKGVIVSNKEVKVGCNEVADPVVLVTPEVLTVAVRISTDFGITGTEFLDSGYPAWRFSILV